jgi:hypothetical protein
MFASKKNIRIEKDLYQRLQEKSAEAGYSSTEEFIVHLLEVAVAGSDETPDREQVDRQLRGLGYLE